VVNNTNSDKTYVEVTRYATELSKAENAEVLQIPIKANAGVVSIPVTMDDKYQTDIKLYDGNSVEKDAIYSNDGSWDFNYDKTNNNTIIQSKSIVTEGINSYNKADWNLYRKVSIAGVTNNYISIYKLMKAAGLPRNMTDYKMFKFHANTSGIGTINVKMVKESLSWENQYSITIPAKEGEQDYAVNLADLVSSNGQIFNANDITSVIISYVVPTNRATNVSIVMNNARFTKAAEVVATTTNNSLSIYPNPTTKTGIVTVNFKADKAEQKVLRVVEAGSGKILYNTVVSTVVGNNQYKLVLPNSITKSSKYCVIELSGYNAANLLVTQQ
jgi:hypothetical protein